MNAKTIKTQMKKANFDLSEWNIEKGYKCYNVILTSFGLSDSEHQAMTGEEVNAKRKSDNDKVLAVASLFNAEPQRSSIIINGEYAPSTWS